MALQGRENAHPDDVFELLLVGDTGVGKSSMISKFTKDTSSQLDFKTRIIQLENKQIKLHIWDPAVEERFTAVYYRGVKGILLVYDVADESSFNNIKSWMEKVDQHASDNVIKILLANKSELNERVVPASQGLMLANNYGIPYFETVKSYKVYFGLVTTFKLGLAAAFSFVPREIARYGLVSCLPTSFIAFLASIYASSPDYRSISLHRCYMTFIFLLLSIWIEIVYLICGAFGVMDAWEIIFIAMGLTIPTAAIAHILFRNEWIERHFSFEWLTRIHSFFRRVGNFVRLGRGGEHESSSDDSFHSIDTPFLSAHQLIDVDEEAIISAILSVPLQNIMYSSPFHICL